MAVILAGASSYESLIDGVYTNAVSLEAPFGLRDGDIAVAGIVSPTAAFSTNAATIPEGWVLWQHYSNPHPAVVSYTSIYTKRITNAAQEPSIWQFSPPTSALESDPYMSAVLMVLRGADAALTFDSPNQINTSSQTGIHAEYPPPITLTEPPTSYRLFFFSIDHGDSFRFDTNATKMAEAVSGSGLSGGRSIAAGLAHIVPPGNPVLGATINNESAAGGGGWVLFALDIKSIADISVPSLVVPTKRTGWKFVLARSLDMSEIGELTKAKNKKLNIVMNRAGSVNFSLRTGDDAAQDIGAVETCVKAYRDGIVRWSGPIWAIKEDLPAETMAVTCVGWQELLNKRLLLDALEKYAHYASFPGGGIVAALVSLMNGQSASRVKIGNAQDTSERSISVAKWQSIGQVIQQLSDIENGFDFEITPEERLLNIYQIKMRDLTQSIHFGYKIGPLHNIKSISRETSGDRLVNQLHMIGKNSSITQVNPESVDRYSMQEEQAALNEVSDPNVMLLYAAAEFAIRSNPLQVYSFAPQNWSEGNPNLVPRIFDDYEVGDLISLSAKHHTFNLDRQPVRIFAASIGIDEEGNENIDRLQVTAS